MAKIYSIVKVQCRCGKMMTFQTKKSMITHIQVHSEECGREMVIAGVLNMKRRRGVEVLNKKEVPR